MAAMDELHNFLWVQKLKNWVQKYKTTSVQELPLRIEICVEQFCVSY